MAVITRGARGVCHDVARHRQLAKGCMQMRFSCIRHGIAARSRLNGPPDWRRGSGFASWQVAVTVAGALKKLPDPRNAQAAYLG